MKSSTKQSAPTTTLFLFCSCFKTCFAHRFSPTTGLWTMGLHAKKTL